MEDSTRMASNLDQIVGTNNQLDLDHESGGPRTMAMRYHMRGEPSGCESSPLFGDAAVRF